MLQDLSVVPKELKRLPGWLLWKSEQVGSDKPRKVPYYANGRRRRGKNGSDADRKQLVVFADAVSQLSNDCDFSGLGFALLPEFGITALDFDRCVDDLGVVLPSVMNLVHATYAELSPSGVGVRAFVHGSFGNHKSLDGDFGFETFSSKGFVTVTGRALTSVRQVAVADGALLAFCQKRFGDGGLGRGEIDADEFLMTYEPPCGLSEEDIQAALDALDASVSYQTWIEVGMALHHETEGAGFDLWDEWSSASDKYPGREALLAHWHSFADEGKRPITARSLLKLAKEANAAVASAAEFEEVAVVGTEEVTRFKPVPAADFAQGKPPAWLIKGVLPQAELAVLYGESGAGKSFVALDMAAALCRGIPWQGRRCKPCRVVYVAAEGAGGFRKRLQAYSLHHAVDWSGLPFAVINDVPNLTEKQDALAVCKAIIAYGGADVIFIDTLAQTTAGANENSGEDMGRFIAHCRGIFRATGALVIPIHHTGKDLSRGARGWSGIRAAADTEIEVSRMEAGRLIRITKQKDGDDGAQWGFGLQVVPIGMDEDGDVVDSCVCVDAPIPQPVVKGVAFGKWEKLVLCAFNALLDVNTTRIATASVLDAAAEMAAADEEGFGNAKYHKRNLERAVASAAEKTGCPYFVDGAFLGVV